MNMPWMSPVSAVVGPGGWQCRCSASERKSTMKSKYMTIDTVTLEVSQHPQTGDIHGSIGCGGWEDLLVISMDRFSRIVTIRKDQLGQDHLINPREVERFTQLATAMLEDTEVNRVESELLKAFNDHPHSSPRAQWQAAAKRAIELGAKVS